MQKCQAGMVKSLSKTGRRFTFPAQTYYKSYPRELQATTEGFNEKHINNHGKINCRYSAHAGQVVVVLFVLMIIAIGMIGVYRVAKLSWKGHLVMWATCLICGSVASWILGQRLIGLPFLRVGDFFSRREGLVWAYENLGIYELMTEDSPLDSADEGRKAGTFFGMFSSLFMVGFVFVGAYGGTEWIHVVSDVTQTFKSILGYIMMCLGRIANHWICGHMMLNEQNS